MPEVAETTAPLPVGGNHTDLLSEVTRPEIAAARRSWLTDSGRGIERTGRFVRLSRANRPDKIWSSRLPDPASVPPAAPSAVIDSRNLMSASIKQALASSMPLPQAFSKSGAWPQAHREALLTLKASSWRRQRPAESRPPGLALFPIHNPSFPPRLSRMQNLFQSLGVRAPLARREGIPGRETA